jgi:hypothetical protein
MASDVSTRVEHVFGSPDRRARLSERVVGVGLDRSAMTQLAIIIAGAIIIGSGPGLLQALGLSISFLGFAWMGVKLLSVLDKEKEQEKAGP